jgi:hypothetical protein
VLQHRAIRLTEEAGAQLDGQIGTDPEDVPVERGVMERAEGKAVGDDRGRNPLISQASRREVA